MHKTLTLIAVALFAFAIVATNGCGRNAVDTHVTGAFIEGGIRAADKSEDEITEKAREFFSDWLKDHGDKDIVNDATGVGLSTSESRLWAFQYGDKDLSTEVEFRVVLPDGREIQEFVAGLGPGGEDPTTMAFANFCMSTFHTVYSCFMNPNDKHMEHETINIDGKDFLYTSNGIFAIGGAGLPDFKAMSEKIKFTLAGSRFTHEPHWLKVVYGQANGEPVVVSVTLDNEADAGLTRIVQSLAWPKSDQFYMAKEFIVLRPQ